MNSHNSYFDPISQITENTNNHKKYSLRRKYQNPVRQQLTHNATYIYPNPPIYQPNSEAIAPKQEQLLNSKVENEGFNFNCMESAQRILDFNQATSLNIKNNHSKTLSTTPSFQNPFMYSNPNSKSHQQRTKDDTYHKNALTKNSLASSKEDIQPTKTKSQKTSVSHKFTHNTNQRLYTQNYSQPPSLAINSEDIDRKHKISLKNTFKFNTQSKSEFLICLKYSDLKQPISSFYKNRLPYNNVEDYAHRASEYNNPFAKYICSTIKGGTQGCQCQPKCFWIDRWTNLIAEQSIRNHQAQTSQQNWDATIKQIDKDLPRTQPEHKTFRIPQYINSLREVLVGYAKLDSQVGYVQGMNFIAAALVYHSRTSYQALRIMEYIMRAGGFRKILLKDLAMSHLVTKRCLYELKRLSFDLYSHFINEEVQIEIFITSWYFSMFGNFIPIESMHLVIDKFIRKQFTGLNEIIITLLIYLKDRLLGLRENNLMMAFSNQQITLTATTIDWSELIGRSNNLLLQPSLY